MPLELDAAKPIHNPVIIHSASKAAHLGTRLGEGPVWRDGTLWQVDILSNVVLRIKPAEKSGEAQIERFPVDEMPGCIVPAGDGGWIIPCRNRLIHMSANGDRTRPMHSFHDIPSDVRFNDGKADPAGRLVVGTMALNARPGGGKLYSFDGNVRCLLDGVTISNGLAWSGDGQTFYYIDTARKCVRAFDYGEDGTLRRERVVVEIPDGEAKPDGMAIDFEGNLWIALWGGHAVGCWNPRNGQQIAKVEVPAKNVTSCAFGGPTGDHLFMTTAGGQGFPGDDPAGDLFVVKPGVSGPPPALILRGL